MTETRLTFLGAAQNVTGSRHLVEAGNTRFLVDCGLYQERGFKSRDWNPLPVPAKALRAILLTHAHVDHCGLLPKLARDGFRGPVYCTPATAEIARIILLDNAKLQQEDAEFKRKRHEREGRRGPYPEVPLYTAEDAQACFRLFSPIRYGEAAHIGRGVSAVFHDAGHVLGSGMLEVKLGGRTVLFSGDIGRRGTPILRDPTVFRKADYVVMESTYGDRLLEPTGEVAGKLGEVVNDTVKARGNLVIPSFAFERAQNVLYYLNRLLMEDRIPHLLVFLDSPMAVRVTDVFTHHPDLFDDEMLRLLRQGQSPFEFPGLTLVRAIEESKAINRIAGSVIVIAGSGMCTGGRIKHHLLANIARPESTILFVGYQAAGTLGRLIVDGAREVRILGQQYPVKARIAQAGGFSAHADRDELLGWLSNLVSPPRHVFVTHGEPAAALSFASLARERTGWEIDVPAYQDQVSLD